MKVIPIICGLVIAFISWTLAGVKAHQIASPPVLDNGEIWLNSVPPGVTLEYILLVMSITVLICGLFQWKAHVKGGNLQTVAGLIMSVTSAILVILASTMNKYGEIYYLAYVSFALGLVVAVVGISQLIQSLKTRKIDRL